MITTVLDKLPAVTDDQRARIVAAPRSAAAHRALMAEVPAMNAVQTGGQPGRDRLPFAFTAAAWNVERCLFPEESAAHLADIAPDVVLLSEVDHGMSRTAQRHTTEAFAAALGMCYCFGVEFYEMGLGGPTERQFCKDDFNALGWHGNAILSSVPITRAAMVRLDQDGHWFTEESGAADPEQPRIGGRMALLAELPSERGSITVVSTHLESNSGSRFRHAQFQTLLDAIEVFSPDAPILIGGDLNTGNHLPPDFDWRQETLFELARGAGYSWDATAEGPTTRPSLITPHPDRVMKLDWLATRGLKTQHQGILTSVSSSGVPLADHDAVWASFG